MKSNQARSVATRRRILAAAGGILLAPYVPAFAQQSQDILKIGFLSASPLSSITARTQASVQGLRDHGYVEGKNLKIEWRSADEQWNRLPQLAADLIKLNVAVIVTADGPATVAAAKATATVPIVMGQSGDPVSMGVVKSVAHPGTNVTGSSTLSTALPGKQVELLKELIPSLSRMTALSNPANPMTDAAWKNTRATAEARGIALQQLSIKNASDLAGAFAGMIKTRVEGVIVLPDPMFLSERNQIAGLAAKYKIPAIYGIPEHAKAGGLITYAASRTDSFRRAADFVDKIVKGAKPADLPVEQPTKFELVVNLKAAKLLGISVPNSILVRADKVIE